MASDYVGSGASATKRFQKVISELQDSAGNERGQLLTLRLDDTTTANVLYIGEAVVGSGTASPVWRIKALNETIATNTQLIFAEGDANFDKAWTLRTTYTYS